MTLVNVLLFDGISRWPNGVVTVGTCPEGGGANLVVGAAGIEPATPTMSTWCSPAELRALFPQVSDTKAVLARIEQVSIHQIH